MANTQCREKENPCIDLVLIHHWLRPFDLKTLKLANASLELVHFLNGKAGHQVDIIHTHTHSKEITLLVTLEARCDNMAFSMDRTPCDEYY